jgi:hypothetical protein
MAPHRTGNEGRRKTGFPVDTKGQGVEDAPAFQLSSLNLPTSQHTPFVERSLNTTTNDSPEFQTFQVMHGTTTQTITGRAEAVTLAKSLSRENNQRVAVERVDGKVQMMFTGGSLDSFNCETRGFKGD